MDEFEFEADGSTFLQPTRPSGPQDWEMRRQRIGWYYIQEDYTLDKLQATMLQKHGFNATRQYCAKLKQWILRKNLAASEKDQIIDKIVAARLLGRSIAEVRYSDRQINLKSLLKHAQSQLPSSDVGSIAEQVQNLQRTLLRRGSTRSVAADTSADQIQVIYQDIDSPESGSPKSDSDQDEWTVIANGSAAIPTHNRLEDNEVGLNTPHILPTLAYAPTLGLEKIISLSQDYVLAALESRMQNMPTKSHAAHLLPWFPDSESAAMHSFWVDVKNALYTAKKHEKDMTFTFASRACEAIQDPTSVEINLGTLKDVLATLSPTNANSCLPLRDRLLHYLSEILSMRFGMQHPLVLLCGELRQETSTHEIYETALRFAIELIEIAHGSQPSDTIVFRRELVRLLRRSGDLC